MLIDRLKAAHAANKEARDRLRATLDRSNVLVATTQKLLAEVTQLLPKRAVVTQLTHQTTTDLPDDFLIKALREVWAQATTRGPPAAVVPIELLASRASRASSPGDLVRLRVLPRTGRARSS